MLKSSDAQRPGLGLECQCSDGRWNGASAAEARDEGTGQLPAVLRLSPWSDHLQFDHFDPWP